MSVLWIGRCTLDWLIKKGQEGEASPWIFMVDSHAKMILHPSKTQPFSNET